MPLLRGTARSKAARGSSGRGELDLHTGWSVPRGRKGGKAKHSRYSQASNPMNQGLATARRLAQYLYAVLVLRRTNGQKSCLPTFIPGDAATQVTTSSSVLYSVYEVRTYEGNNCRRAGQDSTPFHHPRGREPLRRYHQGADTARRCGARLPPSSPRVRRWAEPRHWQLALHQTVPSLARPDRRASPGDLGSRIRLARRRARRPIDPRIMGREDSRRRSSGTKAWQASAFRASRRRGTQRGTQRGAEARAPSGGSVPWLGQGPQRRRREGEIVGLSAGYRLPELIRAACGGNDRE